MPQGTRTTDIPLDVVRPAVLRAKAEKGISWYELARQMGYLRNYKRKPSAKTYPGGDGRAVKRILGIAPDKSVKTRYRQTVHIETVERLADVLGIDPVDIGL